MKRFLVILFALSCSAVGVLGYVGYRAYREVFPALPSGLYVGTLAAQSSGAVKPLFVDSSRNPRDLIVAVGDLGLPAQRVQTTEGSGTTALPLILSGSGSRLRLTGREHESGRYEGTFIDPIRNEKGRWRLQRLTLEPLSDESRVALESWGALYLELRDVERELRLASDGSAAQQEESSENSNSSDLPSLANSLELSGRLTAYGQLVYLSRESIQREGRWIEQVLQVGSPETRPSFQQELERAYRVKDLLDQISRERRLVDKRQPNGGDIEESTEEGFYNDL